jgi:hypothetical protein
MPIQTLTDEQLKNQAIRQALAGDAAGARQVLIKEDTFAR